jgi:hypothetical protein
MARPYLAGGGDDLHDEGLLQIRKQPKKSGPPAWGKGDELTTLHFENINMLRIVQTASYQD